jgi:hypothetical protein
MKIKPLPKRKRTHAYAHKWKKGKGDKICQRRGRNEYPETWLEPPPLVRWGGESHHRSTEEIKLISVESMNPVHFRLPKALTEPGYQISGPATIWSQRSVLTGRTESLGGKPWKRSKKIESDNENTYAFEITPGGPHSPLASVVKYTMNTAVIY